MELLFICRFLIRSFWFIRVWDGSWYVICSVGDFIFRCFRVFVLGFGKFVIYLKFFDKIFLSVV